MKKVISVIAFAALLTGCSKTDTRVQPTPKKISVEVRMAFISQTNDTTYSSSQFLTLKP